MLSAESSTQPARTEGLRLAVAAEQELRKRKRAWVPTFRGAALEAQSITQHEWILAGPAETGKTWAALWRLDSLLRSTPGSRAAILRKVRADMTGTVLETYERIIKIRGGVDKFGGEPPEFYQYGNGARAYVGGMDRPGKVLSGERDWIYPNQAEEFTLEDWEVLTTRCTGRGAKSRTPMIFGDCNPGPPSHWILHRDSLRVLHSRHEDNPTLYDEQGEMTEQGAFTMLTLDALSGVRRDRLRDGRWVAAEGTVYDAFDRAVHVIARARLPKIVRWIGSIDWGFTNPSVFQVWGIDGDGRMYLVRELYRTQRLAEDVAEDIKALLKSEKLRLPGEEGPGDMVLEAIVADHDLEDRATVYRRGVRTRAAIKEIGAGIQKVQARLRVAGDGKPRMFFVEGSIAERDADLAGRHLPTCTVDELEVYAWPRAPDGKPIKETPVDVNNHGCDAGRYATEYVDRSRGPEPTLRERVVARVEEQKIPVHDLTERHLMFEKIRAEEKKKTARPRYLPTTIGRWRRGR